MPVERPRPVLLAVPPDWAAEVSAGICADGRHSVARRCTGLADLLAVAATYHGALVVLDVRLPHLDLSSVERMRRGGLDVVGVLDGDDPQAQERAASWGIAPVLALGAPSRLWTEALSAPRKPFRPDVFGVPGSQAAELLDVLWPVRAPTGRVVAVWGPTGSPGRSRIALEVASRFSAGAFSTILIDADPRGGAQSSLLGLTEDTPGLPAAAREAERGVLTVASLEAHLCQVPAGVAVLTGRSDKRRAGEISGAAIRAIFATCRKKADLTVVDCGSDVEQGPELLDDYPNADAVTSAALEAADLILVVGLPDPLGLARLSDGLLDLECLRLPRRRLLVLNRDRAATREMVPDAQLPLVARIPDAQAGLDLAFSLRRPVVQTSPESAFAAAIDETARAIHETLRSPWARPRRGDLDREPPGPGYVTMTG
ncbi:AAA family ATPase [Gephyromycinifex aptenodytis]|uniref:AAA family ATPase n=1 Tax=Gephyromycinifex aptenodytis TaxID=2716227 RepID=UPI001445483A|nr:hypothetical protein [Gephyromycinifex aptenodytis]